MSEWLRCIACGREYDIVESRVACDCGGLLAVGRSPLTVGREVFDARRVSRRPIDASGVTSQNVCTETSLGCVANHHHEPPAAQTNIAAAFVMAHTRRRNDVTGF